MNPDVSEVKACLRGLLSSSAFSYTLRSLLCDFKNTTGFDLPLFGYKNPVEFLKTLTDTVQLIGDFYNPIVALVESEKSSHITSLVDRQRNKRFDISNSYGRCLPPRLILSSEKATANNIRSSTQCKYSSQKQNNFAQKTEYYQTGFDSVNNGNLNSLKKPEEQRKNYKDVLALTKNYPKYEPLYVSTNLRKDQQQNRPLVSLNQQQPSYESQNTSKDSPNNLPAAIADTSPPFSQRNNNYNPTKVSQETEKKDSCYFEDFSDGSVMGENDKSPPLKTDSTSHCYINDGIKNKLQNLIKKFPGGLWCCELPSSFLKEYNYVLDYREFGCTSLIEMLSELPDVFRCIRPGKEDWILFDASVPPSDKEKKLIKMQENENIASDIANNLHKLLLEHREDPMNKGIELTKISNLYQMKFNTPLDFQNLGFPSLKSFLETYEGSLLNIREIDKKDMVLPIMKTASVSTVPWKEALPPITKDNDIFKEIFPNDVVGPEGVYKKLDLSLHIAVGQRIQVCVAEVWSPAEFCVQLNKFRNSWIRFATELQEFYNMHLNKYKMPDSTIVPQQLCVGLYSEDPENPDEWNRARILKVINERTVMIEFVDFGTVARVRKSQLRFLHKSFHTLPIQAFNAGLYNLAPKNDDSWSMKASKKFLELSRVSYLEAELIDIDFKKPFLTLVLYDPFCQPPLNINKELIAENLARPIEIKNEPSVPEPKETKKKKTFKKEDNEGTFGVVSDEFSDASDLELDNYTALFHFKMKSRKALENKQSSENKEKQNTKEVMGEFEEVPDWDKVDENLEAKAVVKKEESKKSDLFDIKEDALPLKENSKQDKTSIAIPENNLPEMITKRLPPGLEHVVELNQMQILSLEQTEEIKKKINILTVELMTTNPSIKQVAVQDPSLALKIASEMAEVFIRWTCIGSFQTDSFSGSVMPQPQFMLPLPLALPEAGAFSPFIPDSNIQPEKVAKETNFTDMLVTTAKDEATSPPKARVKSKYIQVETVGGKRIHITTINGQVYFFAEELIRNFSTFNNRDVADRVLNLKKVVIQYKILNKNNAQNLLTEIKSFDIPGVLKKKSKKLNVYLIPSETVIKFLQGLGCKTEVLKSDVIRLQNLPTV